MTSKAEIRAQLSGRRQALPPALRRSLDARLIDRALDAIAASGATTVVLFASHAGEPDLSTLESSLPPHCRVAYPRVGADDRLSFRACSRAQLVQSRWGLMEPKENTEEVTELNALAFIPAVAVSCGNGARIGRGGGHYDRALRERPSWTRLAVVYDFQLHDDIAAESHDEPMDGIVTPSVTYFDGGRLGVRASLRRTGETQ